MNRRNPLEFAKDCVTELGDVIFGKEPYSPQGIGAGPAEPTPGSPNWLRKLEQSQNDTVDETPIAESGLARFIRDQTYRPHH